MNTCKTQQSAVSSANTKDNTMHDNTSNTFSGQRRLIAVKPNGTWEAFRGVRECARALGLDNSTVSKCLNGLRPHHEGILFMDVPNSLGVIVNGVYSGPGKTA
jgi:hypothetical protein